MCAGRLIGIARREKRRAPMEEIAGAAITQADGLQGDSRGARFPARQITVLALEAWEAAATAIGEPELAWTVRRANLLVAGVDLPKAKGGLLRIGPVELEITGQTYPCVRMEEARPGLLKALAADWRGGVTCRVAVEGRISLGDTVEVLRSPAAVIVRLPD
jgi:MOSC domain-containing protein YiiM